MRMQLTKIPVLTNPVTMTTLTLTTMPSTVTITLTTKNTSLMITKTVGNTTRSSIQIPTHIHQILYAFRMYLSVVMFAFSSVVMCCVVLCTCIVFKLHHFMFIFWFLICYILSMKNRFLAYFCNC